MDLYDEKQLKYPVLDYVLDSKALKLKILLNGDGLFGDDEFKYEIDFRRNIPLLGEIADSAKSQKISIQQEILARLLDGSKSNKS